MRPFWIRCLVVLLSLALVSGNAHAMLPMHGALHEHCPQDTQAHHHEGNPAQHPHDHHKSADLACCCDCLGCTSAANLTPELLITPAFLPGAVHWNRRTESLAGRALLPEPDPPRPLTLI